MNRLYCLRQVLRRVVLVILFTALVVVNSSVFAQDKAAALMVRSVGMLDNDDSALYSVLVASGAQDALSQMTISATIPDGATFVEMVATPDTAKFEGENAGSVSWQVDRLAANTLLGPFTFRVRFTDSKSKPPLNVKATATAGAVSADAPLLDNLSQSEIDSLQPLAEFGYINVEPQGTQTFQPVGDTGIWLYVPENAVTEPTQFTFTRLPSEDSKLPNDVTCWCASVRLQIDPVTEFKSPFTLALPTRRTLPPYLGAPLTAQNDSDERSASTLEKDKLEAVITGDGGFVIMPETSSRWFLSDGSLVLAAGVDLNR